MKRIARAIRDIGWPVAVSVEPHKSTRSTEQNARYWVLLTVISQRAPEYMGGEYHAPDRWHEYFATRFLGMEAGPFGTGVRKSTTRLKVSEFGDYMTAIEAWAAHEFGITIDDQGAVAA